RRWKFFENPDSCCSRRSRRFECGPSLIEENSFAPFADRARGSLQHLYDTQAGGAVVQWSGVGGDAFVEIRQLRLQCFHLLDLRRPHIAGLITGKQLVKVLAVPDGYALVIDLDLFVSLQIVPNKHLLFAADQSGSDLYRRKPIDIDMRDDVSGEIERNEGDIFVAVEMAFA